MFERIIENYKFGKENLNDIRYKWKYIFLPIYVGGNILIVLTSFILFLCIKEPLVPFLILLSLSVISTGLFIIYSIKVSKKEVEIEANKLDEFFKSNLLEKPEEEYVMPRANEPGVVKLLFTEKGITIDNLDYSFSSFGCSLWTSNYLNKVNLILVFYRTEKGDGEDCKNRGVTQFSMPFNLNMLSIMNKYKIKLKNTDVLRFIKENPSIAAKQILKYGKIQENYDVEEKSKKKEEKLKKKVR